MGCPCFGLNGCLNHSSPSPALPKNKLRFFPRPQTFETAPPPLPLHTHLTPTPHPYPPTPPPTPSTLPHPLPQFPEEHHRCTWRGQPLAASSPTQPVCNCVTGVVIAAAILSSTSSEIDVTLSQETPSATAPWKSSYAITRKCSLSLLGRPLLLLAHG